MTIYINNDILKKATFSKYFLDMKKIIEIQKKCSSLFKKYKAIKLVYLFGSRARGTAGMLSDYDIAVHVAGISSKKITQLRLILITEVSRLLKSDAIDVIVLNTLETPELKYAIISEGILLYEKKPFKMLVEPLIINEYCDFRMMLERYGLSVKVS